MSWFLAFAGFALLVVLHELGHFSVAKAVGMRVEKFSLFFPPTLASKKGGETEYAIGAIPAGGYVKISGMNPDEDLPEEVRDRAYYAQPVWKRITVIAAGPAVNLILALVLLFIYFFAIGPETGTTRVGADREGLSGRPGAQAGRRIVAVDGVRGDASKLSPQIAKHKCAAAAAHRRLRRVGPRGAPGGAARAQARDRGHADLRPRRRSARGWASATPPARGRRWASASRSPTSLDRFWFITKQTLSLPARLFDSEQRKEISGIVGSYEVTRQTILNDVAQVVGILAIISLSLAIVNLFPFLPLDGGHIFWAIVEKVRGKPVPLSVMERAGVVGFMLVIGLFMIGLTNDIDRLSGEGFQVR